MIDRKLDNEMGISPQAAEIDRMTLTEVRAFQTLSLPNLEITEQERTALSIAVSKRISVLQGEPFRK
ncbi:hypothetical protein [Bradyrhizobium sp. WD16]|uniref:hypothetical protein n=1 Tax=Bradyrhizobium sp. WD16 TaxID=1521768 RepID=UPI0020A2FBE3|nr:hypothetical protein [Bradyrhizobium sp. WD16]UTD26364.1 hypothetical protein DB459_04955 [Bradyrhizobium sp. WD16]